jgi:ZIP family zinc transporter
MQARLTDDLHGPYPSHAARGGDPPPTGGAFVSFAQIALLGLIAGATIFIGLPIGRLPAAGARPRAFLSAASVGILLFLFWDVVAGAVEPIEESLHAAVAGEGGWDSFLVLATVAVLGLGAALLGLVGYDRWMSRRRAALGGSDAPMTGAQLAVLIAVGIGLHNFAEGLSIGQSAAAGEIAFALTLVIGFALHNATEGFGIVAPMAGAGERPSWGSLGALGLIGGGPTVLGTVVGQVWVDVTVSVAFLALAAGSILYVVVELIGVNRSFAGLKGLVTAGMLVGLVLGFGTDFVLDALGT